MLRNQNKSTLVFHLFAGFDYYLPKTIEDKSYTVWLYWQVKYLALYRQVKTQALTHVK